MMSDLNMSPEKISDFVSFLLLGLILVIKLKHYLNILSTIEISLN